QQAVAYLRRALEVTPNPVDATEVRESIGEEQLLAGRLAESEATLREAVAERRTQADGQAEIRASVSLADSLASQFKPAEALAIPVWRGPSRPASPRRSYALRSTSPLSCRSSTHVRPCESPKPVPKSRGGTGSVTRWRSSSATAPRPRCRPATMRGRSRP